MTDVFTKRAIGHDEARECARRFIDGHFNNPGRERPRASIPARPDYDDDLLLLSYIKQQEAASPTPPISQNYREEVARGMCCNGICKKDAGSSYSICQLHTFLEDADAAISTLQRLGWKEPGKEEG